VDIQEENNIVALIKLGKDKEVVPLLYKRVYPLVERFIIRNSGNKEDASDIFQDTLLLFYKQVMQNKFNEKYKVFGYLYKVSLHKWINRAKRNRKISFSDDIESLDIPVFEEFSDEIISNPDENIIRKLFSPIGEKCVELLTFTTYTSLLLEDIMLRMQLGSVSAVKMQIKRCKEKLLKQMDANPSLINQLKRQ
jgi:RNA polymerase sigma factor (sigma-70 family)